MIVLDLFAGTGSATAAFEARGHHVVTVEMDEKFDATLHANVWDLSPQDLLDLLGGPPDFVWASPPCTSYSVASVRHHWRATIPCRRCGKMLERVGETWQGCDNPRAGRPLTYAPKSDTALVGQALLVKTLDLIVDLNPRWWAIENPRAMMRKMPILADTQRWTITHCQYGDPRRMKPTDLFGVLPDEFDARACKNGDPCHTSAPRGARTGTQALNKTDKAVLPPLLSVELCEAMVNAAMP